MRLKFTDPDGRETDDTTSTTMYLVIHDTGSSSPEDISVYDNGKQKGRVHTFIDPSGKRLQTTPFDEDAYGTKMDAYEGKGVGQMIHVELILPADGKPTQDQYYELAEIYHELLSSGIDNLIIVPHREVDRGIRGGHSDPRNFDFNHLYRSIYLRYSRVVVPGVGGITQESYSVPNQADMVSNWPPKLKGAVERE